MQSLSLRTCGQRRGPFCGQVGLAKQGGLRLLAIVSLLTAMAISGCQAESAEQTERSREMVVFAAASLTEAFGEIASQFELENPGVTVVLNLAGSQQLAHQLSQGAPADVFASADKDQMLAAVEVNRVRSGSQQPFAGNEMTAIFPIENPAGLRTLSDLAEPGIKIVTASPSVPAGHYATLLLDAAAADPGYGSLFRENVLANIVSYEENVRAVLSKVRLGEADAGIVYQSDVAPELAGEVGQLMVPQHLNVQALYPIAPISDSQNPDLANRFIDFVLSPRGQEILMDNGLKSVAAQ